MLLRRTLTEDKVVGVLDKKKAEESDFSILPTNDIAFKMIFANPRDTRTLMHLPNCAIKSKF
ncbi:MAG: hypothetical protein LBJ03_02575 [Holosporales bacterium]|jgi:hypothetical protein|nr:hypothetical protein [Holosporales bacterium]